MSSKYMRVGLDTLRIMGISDSELKYIKLMRIHRLLMKMWLTHRISKSEYIKRSKALKRKMSRISIITGGVGNE